MKLTGDKQLDAALKELGTGSVKRVSRSAILKALRVITRGIKSEVPPKFKELKRAIGQRFSKDKGGENKGKYSAKSGVRVGFTAKKRAKFRRKDRGNRPGFGVQPENAHWFILGTNNRRTKSGKSTGSTRAILPNLVKDGFSKSEAAAAAALIQGLRVGIQREAAKVRRK